MVIHDIDDETLAEALEVHRKHKYDGGVEAMRQVLLWAQKRFGEGWGG
jgi:hypothetical protein